jgi:hypothetical protein
VTSAHRNRAPAAQEPEAESILSHSSYNRTRRVTTILRFPKLGRIVTFFCLVVALAYGLDAIISHGLRQIGTSKFGSLNKIVSGKVNADIIVNGSSRALNHYDPRIISDLTGMSAYNLGMNGVQIDVQMAVLQTYLKHNTKPKLVVQNIDAFIFEATEQGQIYDPGLYMPYLADAQLYEPLRRIDPAVWKWKHMPLYGYAVEDMRFTWISGLLGCLGYSGREDYFLGFNPRYTEWTEDFERFKASIGDGKSYRIERRAIEAFTSIIETCRAQNIPLIFVYSPEYYEMQGLVRNRNAIFGTIQQFCAKFQILFWDYSESALCQQRDYFYNSQHLNARGAEQFSRELSLQLRRDVFDPAKPLTKTQSSPLGPGRL